MASTALCAALPTAAAACGRRPAPRRASGVCLVQRQQQRAALVAPRALGDNAGKTSKGIRREDEPEEYWSSKMEREGKSPFSDPLAQIGILAILFPFFFLLVAILFGWVDVNGGR